MDEQPITKKQVVQEIAEYLAPHLKTEGFKFLKSKDAFFKKTSFGHYRIYFNIINYWPLKQDYNISISCKNISVQETLSKIKDSKGNRETAYEWIVLPNSNDSEYKELYTSSDIDVAKKESLALIKEDAPSIFMQWSSLEKLEKYYKAYYKKFSNPNNLLTLLIILKLQSKEEEYIKFLFDLSSCICDHKKDGHEEYYLKALSILESIEPM